MSHHSDDHLLQAGSDSFWEPGNYKRTTKRIEDGYRLCTDLQTLLQERAEIEKGYAKNLKAWSKKWGDLIEKGPEYGTIEAAWKAMLTESDRLADIHLKVKENLINGETQQIKTWQKENFHKECGCLTCLIPTQTMMQIKERKEMEDSFKKAQKPWAKCLAKVEKAKSDYHTACKTEKTATNQERNANADSSLSPDQIKKMHDRVQKAKEDSQKTSERYEQSLQEITKYNPQYIEDMKAVFEKCQDMEKTRLQFFKSVLFDIHKSLNFSTDPNLSLIYEEFHHTINNADYEKDLRWWSNNHGVNMPMNWPTFVEYTEEFRDIAKGNKSKEALPVAPILLIHQRPVGEELPEYPPPIQNKNNNGSISRKSLTESTTAAKNAKNEAPKLETTEKVNNVVAAPIVNGTSNNKPEANPFDEEEWDEGDGENILTDNGEPGVPVKALYDYDGAESDELTFKQGEVFDKLEDEDEQGWCKGRKNGKVGLYPANYVEPI